MSILVNIYNGLTAATALKVVPLAAVHETKPPYLVYDMEATPIDHKENPRMLEEVTLDLFIYFSDLEACMQESEKIREALECDQVNFTFSRFEASIIGYDIDTKAYLCSQRYTLKILRTLIN